MKLFFQYLIIRYIVKTNIKKVSNTLIDINW